MSMYTVAIAHHQLFLSQYKLTSGKSCAGCDYRKTVSPVPSQACLHAHVVWSGSTLFLKTSSFRCLKNGELHFFQIRTSPLLNMGVLNVASNRVFPKATKQNCLLICHYSHRNGCTAFQHNICILVAVRCIKPFFNLKVLFQCSNTF